MKTLNRFRFVGIWDPKIRKAGKQLPNVRLIRNVIVTDGNYPAVDMTHMFMQWGQFVDHDMVQVPQFRTGKHQIKVQFYDTASKYFDRQFISFSQSIKH